MKTLAFRSGHLNNRRATLQGLAAVLLAPVLSTAHAQLAVSTAINRTARYRALSQRIAKNYCQIFLHTLPDQALAALGATRKLVRSGFEDLAKVQWPTDLARHVAEIQKQSDVLDTLLVMPPTRESVAAVAVQADRMMAASQAATEAFEKFAKATTAIRNELALGDSQWLFFDAALQRKPDERGLETVGTTSERLLEVTDRLTGLYDAALKEVLG